jgi:predicted ATP-grasp superfamily ATP-dependent carboligase
LFAGRPFRRFKRPEKNLPSNGAPAFPAKDEVCSMPDLIILGASARAAAFSARRAGLTPYAIDLFADRDTATIGPAVKIDRYPSGFLPALAAAPEAPWIYCGGLENDPRLIDRLAAIRPLFGNRGAAVRRARDLAVLQAAAKEAGCRFPRTLVRPFRDDPAAPRVRPTREAAILPVGGTWLVKPRRSGGGANIRLARAGQVTPLVRGEYLQELIAGEAASGVFVAAGGTAELIGVTRQLVGADFGLDRPFLYAGSIGLLPILASEEARLQSLGASLARRCGLTGLFNVDFIRTASDIWPVEVNPRYSASVEVLELALAKSVLPWHLAACRQQTLPDAARSKATAFAGKAILYAPCDLAIPAALDDFLASGDGRTERPLVADIPRIGDRFQSGEPVLTVLAQGASMADVETRLRKRLTEAARLLMP